MSLNSDHILFSRITHGTDVGLFYLLVKSSPAWQASHAVMLHYVSGI